MLHVLGIDPSRFAHFYSIITPQTLTSMFFESFPLFSPGLAVNREKDDD